MNIIKLASIVSIIHMCKSTNWTVVNFPDPVTEKNLCKNQLTNYYCNPDTVFNEIESQIIEKKIEKINNLRVCLCKPLCQNEKKSNIFITIAVVNTVQDNVTAKNLRNKWKRGICENDIFILYVNSTKTLTSFSGKEASKFVSDASVKRSLRHFNNSYPSSGLRYVLFDIFDKIPRCNPEACQTSHFAIFTFLIFYLLLICAVIGLYIRTFAVYKRAKRA